jgi:hypothetical protein
MPRLNITEILSRAVKMPGSAWGVAMGVAMVASGTSAAESAKPFPLQVQLLDAAKLTLQASNALAAPIVHITDKPQPSPSGDPHDYVSYARYWWPDPASSNGLPFIRRDGHHNREQLARGDLGKIGLFCETVESLATAWQFERKTNCALRAGEWLRAWFVTPVTRMNPSLDYAQIRLGHDHNRGSNSGLLDARRFAEVVRVIGWLEDSPALTKKESAAIRQWLKDYLHWFMTSKNGRLERKAANNHGSWYLVQAIAIARFLHDDELARELAREVLDRIARQFAPDGSQPLEMVRTDGLSYCGFNLEAQFQVATLAAPLGVDLWHYTATNGASLLKGIEFLRPYNAVPETWPHNQLKPLKSGFLQPLLDRAAKIWPDNANR